MQDYTAQTDAVPKKHFIRSVGWISSCDDTVTISRNPILYCKTSVLLYMHNIVMPRDAYSWGRSGITTYRYYRHNRMGRPWGRLPICSCMDGIALIPTMGLHKVRTVGPGRHCCFASGGGLSRHGGLETNPNKLNLPRYGGNVAYPVGPARPCKTKESGPTPACQLRTFPFQLLT